MAHQERVNIAVFIDFDNIEIGVKSTLGEHFDVGIILEALKERGEVVTKIAYADWTRAGDHSRALTQHAVRLVQRNLTPGGDKNGADINLALDALEMAFTHTHINAYVIVGGDSDFLSLVEKLKQYDKKVFVIGGRAFTSVILQRNCHEFIAYENLIRKPTPRPGGRPSAPTMASAPIAQAFPIVRRALKVLADREVSPQTGLLKSTLLQLDSTFSERNYGASSFLDFTEKLGQAGLVTLKHSGRSVMVELNPAFVDDGSEAAARPRAEGDEAAPMESLPPRADVDGGSGFAAPTPTSMAVPEAQPRLGDNADGVRIAGQLLAGATNARWPMYLRNAKQILRAASFDERRYGFGGLIDLLKACQRDGLVRIERDRRGGLRVFQGPALRNTAPMTTAPAAAPVIFDIENELQAEGEGDAEAPAAPVIVETIVIQEIVDSDVEADPLDLPPVSVVDTTAELLGRATGKGSRTRRPTIPSEASSPAANRGNRAPRKAAGGRRPAVDRSRGRGRKNEDGNR